MGKVRVDISCRNKKHCHEMFLYDLPLDKEHLRDTLSLLAGIKKDKGTALLFYLEDQEKDDDVPQTILIADSPKGIYMELGYSMADWEWETPLLLANDHLTEDEAVSILESILGKCEDQTEILMNGFCEVSSRVFAKEGSESELD